MKSTVLCRLIAKLSLLVIVVSGVSGLLFAQQEEPQQRPPITQQQQQADPMNHPQAATPDQVPDSQAFNGKIVKSGGQLVFQDNMVSSTYRIEDQSKVKAFENKDVKITGAVDPSTNTIYIASIEPQ